MPCRLTSIDQGLRIGPGIHGAMLQPHPPGKINARPATTRTLCETSSTSHAALDLLARVVNDACRVGLPVGQRWERSERVSSLPPASDAVGQTPLLYRINLADAPFRAPLALVGPVIPAFKLQAGFFLLTLAAMGFACKTSAPTATRLRCNNPEFPPPWRLTVALGNWAVLALLLRAWQRSRPTLVRDTGAPWVEWGRFRGVPR